MGEKRFSLKVGDLFKDTETKTVYKVIRVYKHYVQGVDFDGHLGSFTKGDFICGLAKEVPKE